MNTIQTLAALALTSLAFAANAQVSINDPWVRATVPQQRATGAFMQLKAEKPVRLVAGKSPVASTVEIHEMTTDNGVMKMRQLPGIDIAAGQALELKPGSYHLMLMGLTQQMKDGDTVPITLEFVGADNKKLTTEIKAPVRPLVAAATAATGHKH